MQKLSINAREAQPDNVETLITTKRKKVMLQNILSGSGVNVIISTMFSPKEWGKILTFSFKFCV
jgi:hypothetical protein